MSLHTVLNTTTIITIEIVYALPNKQTVLTLQIEPNTTVQQAIQRSEILKKYPEIDLESTNKVGIYGKQVKLDTILRHRDRIEIYRPLIADPKEIRRKRATESKNSNKE